VLVVDSLHVFNSGGLLFVTCLGASTTKYTDLSPRPIGQTQATAGKDPSLRTCITLNQPGFGKAW